MLEELVVCLEEPVEPKRLEVPMIRAVQNLVRLLYSCVIQAVPSRGKNHIRGMRGQRLAGTSPRLNTAYLAGLFACLTFCSVFMPTSAGGTISNVVSYAVKNDRETDVTLAINSAIAALERGDTLL